MGKRGGGGLRSTAATRRDTSSQCRGLGQSPPAGATEQALVRAGAQRRSTIPDIHPPTPHTPSPSSAVPWPYTARTVPQRPSHQGAPAGPRTCRGPPGVPARPCSPPTRSGGSSGIREEAPRSHRPRVRPGRPVIDTERPVGVREAVPVGSSKSGGKTPKTPDRGGGN